MSNGISNSCWKNCLWENGCYPWKISRLETIVHSIPGVGILSSCIGWGHRSSRIDAINTLLFEEEVQSTRVIHTLVINDEEPETLSEPALFDDEVSEADEDRLRAEGLELAAKKSNCKALFLLNVAVTLIGGATFYTLKKFEEI